MSNHAPIKKLYNVEEFLKFIEPETQKPGNENNRYELIDGIIYMMAYQSMTHYNICKFIESAFANYFENNGYIVINGSVALFLLDTKYFESFNPPKSECKDFFRPDLMVICDNNAEIKNDTVHSIPDIVVEVVSKSNAGHDYIRKLNAYYVFGVKEYWLVDPIKRKIRVYDMHTDFNDPREYDYTFDHIIRSELFDDLYVNFKQFTEFVEDQEINGEITSIEECDEYV